MDIRRADTIRDELEQLIVTGGYADGDRLDETSLAQRFGVSRTPVREALQKLTSSGLVQAIPRRGVFVRQPGPVMLLEMFETMAELEASCGRLAATRMSNADLLALREINAACEQAAADGDAELYYRENERFHHLIYRGSGNAFLEDHAAQLHKRLKPYRRMQLHLRGRLQQSMGEHLAILEALSEGEAEAAGAALRAHVAVQGEKFHHLLSHLRDTE